MLIVHRFDNTYPHPARSALEAAAIDKYALEHFLNFFSEEAQRAALDRNQGARNGEWFDAPCFEAAKQSDWLEHTWNSLNDALVKRENIGYVGIQPVYYKHKNMSCRT